MPGAAPTPQMGTRWLAGGTCDTVISKAEKNEWLEANRLESSQSWGWEVERVWDWTPRTQKICLSRMAYSQMF